MKLTKKKIRWIIRQKEKKESSEICSGEDCLKRLSWVSVSEFLVGELMKRSSYLKLRSVRNSFRTEQKINSEAKRIMPENNTMNDV